MGKTNLFGLFAEEIAVAVGKQGLEKYRGKQIAAWMYQRFAQKFEAMTDLPKRKRAILEEYFSLGSVTIQAEQHGKDGKTSKFLLAFADGVAVETVLMRQSYGNSVCISSQVGCNMGCTFCASTIHGLVRNLTEGEMLAQVLFISEFLSRENETIHSVVIMGSGEPLANYENVLRFIRLCHESYCLNLSYRHFTLSTAGLVPEIDRLATEGLPITLAISLHAPNNELRSQLMPINKKYPIETVMAAADRYASQTGRRVTYEYTLIKGLNDQDQHVKQLAQLLRGRLANINVIPVNPVVERGLLRPDNMKIQQFLGSLRAEKVNATLRRELGTDIKAACGQLRHAVLANQELNEE